MSYTKEGRMIEVKEFKRKDKFVRQFVREKIYDKEEWKRLIKNKQKQREEKEQEKVTGERAKINKFIVADMAEHIRQMEEVLKE